MSSVSERRELFAQEMHGKFVPMNVENFLEIFVPKPSSDANRRPDFKEVFATVDFDCAEDQLYIYFTERITKYNICPGYTFLVTPNLYLDDSMRRVDFAAYYEDSGAGADWGGMALPCEAKTWETAEDSDPFDDDPRFPNEPEEPDPEQARGQIISYTGDLHAQQHRLFSFSLLIMGPFARILRWDRSGAVYTRKFDYNLKPEPLCEFLWRFARLSSEQQGCDPTARLVEKGSEDYQKMLDQSRNSGESDYKREYYLQSLDEEWPWWKLKVEWEEQDTVPSEAVSLESEIVSSAPVQTRNESQSSRGAAGRSIMERYFLVGKPHFIAPGVIGRSTRGYVALDLETGEFVFLKDTWRLNRPGITREGDILLHLQKHEVRFVPTIICHGDVADQSTVPIDYWSLGSSDKERNYPPKENIHYRLAVAEVGRPLSDFRNARELVAVLAYIITAHQDAYERAGILHRDISPGNILLVSRLDETGEVAIRGMLNDWDLCKSVWDDTQAQSRRTGTWPFISGLLLKHPHKNHTLGDDLESIFHVLLYYCVRFLRHNCVDVSEFVDWYFDSSYRDADQILGGRNKEIYFQCDYTIWETNNRRIQGLITTMRSWFKALYSVYAYEQRTASDQLVGNPSLTPSYDDFSRQIAKDLLTESEETLDHEGEVCDENEDKDKVKAEERRKAYETAQSLQKHGPMRILFARTAMNMTEDLDFDKTAEDQLLQGTSNQSSPRP